MTVSKGSTPFLPTRQCSSSLLNFLEMEMQMQTSKSQDLKGSKTEPAISEKLDPQHLKFDWDPAQ